MITDWNDDEIAAVRQRLLDALASLAEQDALGEDGQNTVMLDQQSVGRLSRMDALQQQAMAQATHNRRRVEQDRIRAALARIDEGEFGYCNDCGEAIARERININPAVTLCLSCAKG